jgi:hypothetical protein
MQWNIQLTAHLALRSSGGQGHVVNRWSLWLIYLRLSAAITTSPLLASNLLTK